MSEVIEFKSGKDLAQGTRVDDDDTVTCVDCGTRESDQRAYENGWQLAPVVCPECLRWTLVADDCCFERLS